jgi:hypothetical protein
MAERRSNAHSAAAAGGVGDASVRLERYARWLLRQIQNSRAAGGPGDNAFWILEAGSGYVQALASWSGDDFRVEARPARLTEANVSALAALGFELADAERPNAWLNAKADAEAPLRLAKVAAAALLLGDDLPSEVITTLKLPGQAPRRARLVLP